MGYHCALQYLNDKLSDCDVTHTHTKHTYAANNFVVVLSVQNNHVHIEATLPVPIVGVFSLKVRFYKSKTTEDAVLHHLSLMDTNIINLAIPDKQLPSFRDFTVAIAMVVRDEVGQFSSPSNRLGKEICTIV